MISSLKVNEHTKRYLIAVEKLRKTNMLKIYKFLIKSVGGER